MHPDHGPIQGALERRAFLVASGVGFAGLHLPSLLPATPPRRPGRAARSAILIWLSGGASHIDTWDMKPDAPAEFRGPFQPRPTSAPGVQLCEHLPLLARQAHHLAIVRSLGHYNRGTGDHHAGYYYNLTGHAPDPTFRQLLNDRRPRPSDWPFVGSVVTSKRPAHPYLPSLITLPQKPGFPRYTRPGQFAARLGLEHDAAYLLADASRPLDFAVPALTLQGDVDARRLTDRRSLLTALDRAARSADVRGPEHGLGKQQEKAFALLAAARRDGAFDLHREPLPVRERYGHTVNGTSLLMARRLVEAGVPFVTVFWKEDARLGDLCKSGGGWDTHGSNFVCLRDHLLPEFDRCFSALLGDLHDRGLLRDTLVMVNSEMGRQPRIGDPRSGGPRGAGRDHWTHCMSVLLAGGGVRGGQVYGTSDKVAGYPADRAVAPEDVAHTVYYSLGVTDLEAIDREGRPFHLLPEGRPLLELFDRGTGDPLSHGTAVACTSSQPEREAEEADMNAQPATCSDVKKLGELIQGVKVAMLTTTAPDGRLRSRPMVTQDTDFDGALWFFTQEHTPKVDEVESHEQVNVSYAAPHKERYVSVSGTASIVTDREKLKHLWSPVLRAWFPKGPDDPDLALLRVEVEQAEYWDAPSNTAVHLVGFAGALS